MSVTRSQRVYCPRDLTAALTFLAEHREEGWQPLAGGTDILVGMYRDRRAGDRWLNLAPLRRELAEVRWIAGDSPCIAIGALATMAELHHSPLLAQVSPLLAEAAGQVGAMQVQQRATVGGNIANGSPAADTMPVWLALDAWFELASVRGIRSVPSEAFATGYRRNQLEPDELLIGVKFQPRLGRRHWGYFRKIAPRAAQGISKVVFAGLIDIETDRCQAVRLALGSVGPTGLRARQTEQVAEGHPFPLASSATGPERSPRLPASNADVTRKPSSDRVRDTDAFPARTLLNEIQPIDDARSTAAYRSRVALNLVREFLAGNLGAPYTPLLPSSSSPAPGPRARS